MTWYRIAALARKDAAELLRNPGAILPAILMVFASLFPAFLVIVVTPRLIGERLEESEFSEQAANAAASLPELAGLAGDGLVQAYMFHQFSVLLLLVPIVGAMALATHAVIGEKQAKALEPILATPITTIELLVAKTLAPFLFALALSWTAVLLYLLGVWLFGEPGVWQAVAGGRLVVMFVVVGPLVELAALLLSVIVSSRASDPRSAQQISALLILPVTAVFIAQLMGALILSVAMLLAAALGALLINLGLLAVGVQVFHRETILTRWT